MARQRQRKTIEELYGNKFDATKSQVTTNSSATLKNGRLSERDYGYIINSNAPYSSIGPVPPPSVNNLGGAGVNSANAGGHKETSRRKSARLSAKIKGEPYNKETKETIENSKELNIKLRTSRGGVARSGGGGGGGGQDTLNMYDNKFYGNYIEPRSKDVQARGDGLTQYEHHPHHHRNSHTGGNSHERSSSVRHDDDKDDDTEEFFQLIRQTVESAIGKSISELLNRNFRELTSKVERFSAELKNTNALLSKMETDINNKIVHYGEENSRHFRYLCMKSEYDKMFYQHQSMITAATPTPPVTRQVSQIKNGEKRKSFPKMTLPTEQQLQQELQLQTQQMVCEKPSQPPTPCSTCRSTKSKKSSPPEAKETHKVSSGEVSQRSSDIGMREVLEHIQKFCNQVKSNEFKCDRSGTATPQKHVLVQHEDELMINNDIFADDFEGLSDVSSDGMTPRSEQSSVHKYGGSTMRGSIRDGNNGGGDA